MSKESSLLKWFVRTHLKREVEWAATHYCRHGHAYLAHINCLLTEGMEGKLGEDCPIQEKVAFLDLECSNLKASFGFVFSYCLKELDGDILGRPLTPEEIRPRTVRGKEIQLLDQRLMSELCKDLRKFDRIVVHFGSDRKFDIPFARSRSLKWKLDFPLYREVYVHDTWNMAKSKLCLHSNRLEAICDFFDIPSKGHRLNSTMWTKANAGSQEALDFIFEHNKEDVISLEEVWKRLNHYVPRGKASI